MIKLYFLHVWFLLSDRQAKKMMHDWHAVQGSLALDLGRERPPDESTSLWFRRRVEKHGLAGRMLQIVNAHLARAGIRVRTGTIVDATVIEAAGSTKNKRVEHVFGVIKYRFGWRKVRLRGIFNNLQYDFGVVAAFNLYLRGRVLLHRNPGFREG